MKYDKDDKIKRLVDTIGELLLEKGHQAIGINQVAAHAGISKPIIYDYFGSLNELVKAYIRKKDYWMPFFDQLELPDAGDRAALEAFFTVTLQEEFLYFFQEPEMQRLILWQISTISPLMRSISETREREGLKLLALADPYFRESGISFRAVSALIVGGIYYMVLHGVYNKSTVCGIDVNQASDRAIVLKTVGALVSLAWQKAIVGTVDKEILLMNHECEVLAAIAAGLNGRGYSGELDGQPDVALSQEAARLNKAIEAHALTVKNEMQLSSYINLMLQKLTEVADILYQIEDQPSAETQVVLEVMSRIRRSVQHKVNGQLRLPLAFIYLQVPQYAERWSTIQAKLTKLGIDPVLIEVAGLPLDDLKTSNPIPTWHEYVWLKRLLMVLEEADWDAPGCGTADESLISRLIRLDYNQQRFLAYCYRMLKQKMQQRPGKSAKLEELHRCRTLVMQDAAMTTLRYDRHAEPVVKQLCNWIDAEMALVREIEPDERPDNKTNPHKFNYKINAAGIAVWHKLQNDHGLLDEKVDDLSVKIAYNCSSVGQSALSGPSQRSKFYTTDEKVIRPLADVMQEMLDDLKGML